MARSDLRVTIYDLRLNEQGAGRGAGSAKREAGSEGFTIYDLRLNAAW
jgi:hypothetical protein